MLGSSVDDLEDLLIDVDNLDDAPVDDLDDVSVDDLDDLYVGDLDNLDDIS